MTRRTGRFEPKRTAVWGGAAQSTANFGDMGEITSFGTDTFTTDHFGNMKTQMVGLNTTTFNWDFESHLTGIDYPGTSNDDSHEYDGNGLRMRSKLNGAGEWTNFVWDEVAGNLVAEYTLISGTFTLKSANGWGAGLLWTNREGTKRYFHFDGSGSTWALTDASQNITDTYEYTSFGVAVASSGSSVNPFRWMGESGAYDDGARGSAQGLVLLSGSLIAPSLGLASIQRRTPCADILKGVRLTKQARKLVACVLRAIPDQGRVEECVREFGRGAEGAFREALNEYIGCLFGETQSPIGGNPCSPRDGTTCYACCYSQYITCLLNCNQKKNLLWGKCLDSCREKIPQCQLQCSYDLPSET